MVTKSKPKSTKNKPKSVKTNPKSSSNKSTKKSNKTPNETKMSLLSKTAITGLGAVATLGTGYVLNKELIPYLTNNYGVYPFIYPKLYKQFIEKDRQELYKPDKTITFRTYIDQELYRIRDNYEADKKNGKIKKYNDNPQNMKKITRMYDYIKIGTFEHERPYPRKFGSLDNLPQENTIS